jgi:hypothetical protein
MLCKTCKTDKAAADFYEADPHHCRACVCERVRAHRRANDSVREYDRARSKTPKVRKRLAANSKNWRAANPDRYKAQIAVGNALRAGTLKREPCYFCAAEFVHGHHEDYSKPLEVIWLCPRCHHRLHALEKSA